LGSQAIDGRRIAELERRLAFLNDIDADPTSGWCGEHPRRFAINSSDDGEECQKCRADKADAMVTGLRESHAELVEAVKIACCAECGDLYGSEGMRQQVPCSCDRIRAALAHAAPLEPEKLPLGHVFVGDDQCAAFISYDSHDTTTCGQPASAHAAPSVGEVK